MTQRPFIIAAEDVNKSFDGFQAIRELNFYMDVGELRTVIGPNGAGKTTFLDLITGRTKPDTGKIEFLNEHDWPGNIRQLRNLLERMVVLSRGDILTLDDLPRELSRRAPSDDGDDEMSSDTKLEKIERTAILQALEKVGGNKSRAAELLGISVRTLHLRLKRWDVLEARGN